MLSHETLDGMLPNLQAYINRTGSIAYFCFTLRKYFVFVICRHFTTLKWLKVFKLSKICSKMVKAMTPKNYRSEHFVSQ